MMMAKKYIQNHNKFYIILKIYANKKIKIKIKMKIFYHWRIH